VWKWGYVRNALLLNILVSSMTPGSSDLLAAAVRVSLHSKLLPLSSEGALGSSLLFVRLVLVGLSGTLPIDTLEAITVSARVPFTSSLHKPPISNIPYPNKPLLIFCLYTSPSTSSLACHTPCISSMSRGRERRSGTRGLDQGRLVCNSVGSRRKTSEKCVSSRSIQLEHYRLGLQLRLVAILISSIRVLQKPKPPTP